MEGGRREAAAAAPSHNSCSAGPESFTMGQITADDLSDMSGLRGVAPAKACDTRGHCRLVN